MAASLIKKARCDPRNRQARNDAQRQRDLLGRWQVRMAANEQQAQNVVTVVRLVEPVCEWSLGIAQIGNRLVRRQGF